MKTDWEQLVNLIKKNMILRGSERGVIELKSQNLWAVKVLPFINFGEFS